jgi:RNA polymerase sigma-70 factor (ECF subfamily)
VGNDFELLASWKSGDEAAASRLIRRHFSRVYQFFRSKLDDQFDDLTQRTFTACLEARDRIPDHVSFRAYLLGIARKQLLMHFRTKMRREKRIELLDVSAIDLGASPSHVAAVHEEQQVLLAALRLIPVDLQIAIELFYWEEMTAAEIGVVLEIPEGTVRSRLRRARDLLKERIDAMGVPKHVRDSTIHDLEQWAGSLRGALGKEEI